jgi:dihydropyrimidinase
VDLLVKNARVVTPSDTFECNIGIENGKIASLSRNLRAPEAKVFDADGMIVVHGGIDAHTHMELPVMDTASADDFYSGTVAAACGGVTTIIDFVDPKPDQTMLDALADYRNRANRKVVTDYGLHMMFKGQNLREIDTVPEVIKEGVPSFKVYTAYKKRGLMLEDDEISRVMKRVAGSGGLIAKAADAELYIVHLSSKAGKEEVEEARTNGTRVFAETCPHYLVLTDQVYEREDGRNFVMSPALKKADDCAALWAGLRPGGVVETVGSDHCPFTSAEKDSGRDDFTKIPSGVPGTEVIIPLLYSEGVRKGRISIFDMVRVTSSGPARRFGLPPSKGSIAVGSDADLVVIDPNVRVRLTADKLHTKIDYSIYDHITTEGYPILTISRGEIVMEHGNFVGKKGRGRFIPRGTIGS